ncbi:hypothetical protein VPNG_08197 [Cytospora leucostoma]|uniref:Helicase ATP-binding domain-containing protein n=1 Tax=Cytospora leucostoma TaxID=1230097 RepID=A0A423W7A0_9PEZI|nr:hypothetical protein VPNG_08197 [Cytospora leucostoma]
MAPSQDAVAIIRSHVIGDNPPMTGSSWKTLTEFPTADELMNPQATTNDLPVFPIDGLFPSKEHYLEALYKILRFEGIEGLRFSVNTFRSRPIMNDDQNTCIYTKVHVKGYLMSRLGPICRISFSTRRAGRRINWKQSKRLLPGKIVALSTDQFHKDCRVAVVAQRPIEGGLDQSPPSIDIFWGDSEQAVVDPDQELIMVESKNGFYEAVRHALTGLQQATEKSTFDSYLVSLDNGDRPAGFIAAAPNLDLTSLIHQLTPDQLEQASGNKHVEQLIFEQITAQYRECNILRQLPDDGIALHTSLDSSQLEALQRMLSREVAIVQGPPGTGKTFTSVKAIGAMLANRRPGDPPIIIAAQTNHALDQLLIYCHSAGARIMRVGGRTENEVIKERTVYNLRNSAGKMANDGQYRSLEKGRLRIVERFSNLVSGVFGNDELIDPEALLNAGIINESQFKSLTDEEWEGAEDVPPIQMWLGDEQIERIRQQADDLDFPEEEILDEELDPDLEDEAADDDEDRLRGTWVPLTSHFTGKTPRVPDWRKKCIAKLDSCDDLYDIPLQIRGGVYQILQARLRDYSKDRFHAVLGDAVIQAKEQKVNKWARDLHVIDKHCINVIGCTTTGLSKYRGFLAATKARILLIEEAAETREANVTSALCTFPTLEQLVLVGDHQQLPPQCDIERLGDAPFHLNTSLFERLVDNGLPYTMLNRQRRMAPELSYIVKQYYPDLMNHPVVEDVANRPPIPGMGFRRSWFFTHEWPEETDADCSKFNMQEAEMVVAFMKYLIQNGIEATQITVLTYYRGQRKKILQRLRRDSLLLGTNYFNVATVDSYQGEENEVVLLSLVRSPKPHDICRVGFLESQNRATVAVSRARRGFFMFGNKKNLFTASDQSFDVWAPVWNGFADQTRVSMGKGLPLICQNHEQETWMKTPEDFLDNAGGCRIRCSDDLPCGHRCSLMCHILSHETLPCLRPCRRTLFCGHKCSQSCTDKCRCAEDCRKFHLQQAGQQSATQQIQGDVGQARARASQFESQECNSSPEKWLQFSHDIRVHDDAIRQTRLQAMKEQELSARPLIDLDTSETTVDGKPGGKASDTIHERFIPIANQDGRRILGETQVIDDLRDIPQPKARAKQQQRRQAQRGQPQKPRQRGQGQRAASQQDRQLVTRPNAASADVFTNTSAIARRPGQSQIQAHVAAQDRARNLFPTGRRPRQVAEPTIGESDLGFEAEVLGIRQGHTTQADRVAPLEEDLHHPHMNDNTETMISFDGQDGGQLRVATGAKQPSTSAGRADDDEPALLIDI